MNRYFFSNASTLANLFTEPKFHNREQSGKLLEGGMKPIEAFVNDIYQNLTEWATDGVDTVFYRTTEYWYAFTLNQKENIIEMARFKNGTIGVRLDDWANIHSLASMREFRANNLAKKIELIKVG